MTHTEDIHGLITTDAATIGAEEQQSYRQHLSESIRRAFHAILDKLDYRKISAVTGRDSGTLRDEAGVMLRQLLSDYPNCTASVGYGWHLSVVDRSFGIRSVEASFPLTWHSELVVDFGESAEAIALGMLDEDGDPTHPAPACWHCKRPIPAPDLITIDPKDPEVLTILSQLCFQVADIAHLMQAAGQPIKRKAEDEQAAVLLWMLTKLHQHGKDWRVEGDKELNALRAQVREKLAAESAPADS